MVLNELTEKIIGAAINVHRTLGPGFLEAVYQAALAYELKKAKIPFEKEKLLPVVYERYPLMQVLDVIFWLTSE